MLSEKLLTVKDLSARYSLTAKTIRGLIKTGRLPAPIIIGRSARWLIGDIENFEKSRAMKS